MRTVYSCIVDNQPIFAYQAYLWAGTLIELAQRSPEELVVHLTEACEERVEAPFRELGVTVARLKPFDVRHPHSNKLAQLESPALRDADTIVLTDCDLAFSGDLVPYLTGDGLVRAKPVDCANLTPEHWTKIYAEAGFSAPKLTAASTIDNLPTLSGYCNGGLLILPRAHFETLRTLWPKWNRWALDHAALLEPFTFFTDQVSFALALQEMGNPIAPLPIEANCPTHLPFPADFALTETPRALHFHSHVNPSGFLLPTSVPAINIAIDRVNDHIRKDRRVHFDNYLFRQFRYHMNPELGSGLESRGENLKIKRSILAQQIETKSPKSVLDVGCGDLQFVKTLPITRYTGLDISPAVIEQARAVRPDWSYLSGDITKIDVASHDLVMCLDVLIHQPTAETYERCCRRLIDLSERYLILAGYNQPPWYSSEITFYYEPLSETISRLGNGTLEIIGGYRDTTVLLWTRSGVTELDTPPTSNSPATLPEGASPGLLSRLKNRLMK